MLPREKFLASRVVVGETLPYTLVGGYHLDDIWALSPFESGLKGKGGWRSQEPFSHLVICLQLRGKLSWQPS